MSESELEDDFDLEYSEEESNDGDDVEETTNVLTSQESFDTNEDIIKKIHEPHQTLPYLTKYEKTKILGLRAQQISYGSVPFVVVPPHVTDSYEIAQLELTQKKLPYLIKRPIGKTEEYWRLSDMIY